jgi:hypothetical protein
MIAVSTSDPAGLLRRIKSRIDDKDIVTWAYDADGDFTHSADQWNLKAWLRPTIGTNRLSFGILRPGNTELTKLIYGIYHGRFGEMLLVHFDEQISSIELSANLRHPDSLS